MRILFLFLIFLTLNSFADADLVKVDKSDRRMYLMENGNIVKVYHIALGANPKGHKIQEGDEKTPEGAYILDYIKLDSAFYKAMHISYPNSNDIAGMGLQGWGQRRDGVTGMGSTGMGSGLDLYLGTSQDLARKRLRQPKHQGSPVT